MAEPGPEAEPQDPAEVLAEAERQLIEAPVRVRFTVKSAGVLACDFVGVLAMEGARVNLAASGNFAGLPVELAFEADGTRMHGKGGAQAFDLPQPVALREGLGVGIVRMGILHTLAMLVSGQPPEVPEDGVRTWLVTTPMPGAPTVAVMEPVHTALPPDPITFRTAVAGDDAVTATVWIEDGQLRERQQETRFPDGTMTVLEAFDPLE